MLLYCPDLKGHVAQEIVVGAWRFDANRRTFGYWVSDVGQLDPGFAETGPWIEYHELHPRCGRPCPPVPSRRRLRQGQGLSRAAVDVYTCLGNELDGPWQIEAKTA